MTIEERNKIVTENMNLVWNVVWTNFRGILSLHHPMLSEEDLFQEGVQGLIRAADKYDASRGTAFSTYANRAIRNAICALINKVLPKNAENKLQMDVSYDELQTQVKSGNVNFLSRSDLYYNQAFDNIALESFLQTMERLERRHARSASFKVGQKIIRLRYEGYSKSDILEMLNLSEEEYHRIMCVTRNINGRHRDDFSWLTE